MPSEGRSTPRSRRSTVPWPAPSRASHRYAHPPPARRSGPCADSSGRKGSKNARSKLSARTVRAIVSAGSPGESDRVRRVRGTRVSRQGSVPWTGSGADAGPARASMRSPVRVQSSSGRHLPTVAAPIADGERNIAHRPRVRSPGRRDGNCRRAGRRPGPAGPPSDRRDPTRRTGASGHSSRPGRTRRRQDPPVAGSQREPVHLHDSRPEPDDGWSVEPPGPAALSEVQLPQVAWAVSPRAVPPRSRARLTSSLTATVPRSGDQRVVPAGQIHLPHGQGAHRGAPNLRCPPTSPMPALSIVPAPRTVIRSARFRHRAGGRRRHGPASANAATSRSV